MMITIGAEASLTQFARKKFLVFLPKTKYSMIKKIKVGQNASFKCSQVLSLTAANNAIIFNLPDGVVEDGVSLLNDLPSI